MHNKTFIATEEFCSARFILIFSISEGDVHYAENFVNFDHLAFLLFSDFKQHWHLFCPQLALHEIFGMSIDVQELLQRGQLVLDDR